MNWDLFGWFAAVSLCLWGFGAFTAWKGKSMGWVLGPTLAGSVSYTHLDVYKRQVPVFILYVI